MPVSLVRDAFAFDDSVAVIASRFGVSHEAMHWRLYNSGLIGEAPG